MKNNKINHYRTDYHHELDTNHSFHHTHHRIHTLMNLYMAMIVIDKLCHVIAKGLTWSIVESFILALAIHVIVEMLLLNGFSLFGSAIIIAEEFVHVEHAIEHYAHEHGHLPWEEWVGAGIAVVLAGLGVYLLVNKDIRAFSKRANQIVRADFVSATTEE